MRIKILGPLPKEFTLTRNELKAAATAFACASQRRLKGAQLWHEVVVHLVSDAASSAYHQAVMGLDGATDVITQAYDAIPPEEPGLFGELIVNTQQALRCARVRASWNPTKELLLYVAHGMDHLSGADDYSPQDYATMRRRELRWLRQLPFI